MKNRKLTKVLSYCLFVSFTLAISSCTSYKKIGYFNNIDETANTLQGLNGIHEPRIKPYDILQITVNSTIPGAAADFNMPKVPVNLNNISTTSPTATSQELQDYLVNENGMISFPVLGDIKASGKTTTELEQYIISQITPKHIIQAPIVNVRYKNFEVSVTGEVNRPGTYSSDNGQITILEALAAAGDMTIYGKRDNVLLIRINETGAYDIRRLNMQDATLLENKDIFYLQQNDMLYVEPNKTRGNNSRFGTLESLSVTATLSALSVIISIIGIITRN